MISASRGLKASCFQTGQPPSIRSANSNCDDLNRNQTPDEMLHGQLALVKNFVCHNASLMHWLLWWIWIAAWNAPAFTPCSWGCFYQVPLTCKTLKSCWKKIMCSCCLLPLFFENVVITLESHKWQDREWKFSFFWLKTAFFCLKLSKINIQKKILCRTVIRSSCHPGYCIPMLTSHFEVLTSNPIQ